MARKLFNERKTDTHVFGLYLKLSAWLIPTFLVSSVIGLHFLSKNIVTEVETALSDRIANLSARVANGLEYLGEEVGANGGTNDIAARQIMKTLLADPAITCAELVSDFGGRAFMQVPTGVGCEGDATNHSVSIPIYYGDSASLLVRWSNDEVEAARIAQRETSLVILMVGLVLALLTNWLAFRVIIGRPLNDLIRRNETARSEAEYNALHDPLTGLANRRKLELETEKVLARAKATNSAVTLLHLDLDGFKAINDTMGHAVGDAALIHVSGVLASVVEKDELVARVGGDEFVVLLRASSETGRAIELSKVIIDRLEEKLTLEGEICSVGASVGIASALPDKAGFGHDALLHDADIALYQAKEQGKGRFVVCTDEMRIDEENRKTLAQEIERAVQRDEFIVHYQPIFDGDGRTLVGAEALVRWQHPKRGLLMPADFVGLAKELHLLDQIDKLVLEQALRELPIWDRAGTGVQRISLNVSARRLNSPDLIGELRALKIPHGRLVFEVLEGVYLDPGNQHLAWNLEALNELGIDVEIDDFGTGQASIGSIIAIRPRRLKLARDIISGSEDILKDDVVRAVIGLAQNLGIEIVAQGIENQEQLEKARALGFSSLQGFALGQPQASSDIIRLVNSTKSRKAG